MNVLRDAFRLTGVTGDLDTLLRNVADRDTEAFAALYDHT